MPVLTYEFLPDIFENPRTKKRGVIYRPYVLIKLGNGNKWNKNFIKALVDSGADTNLFPTEFAKEIGLNYKTGMYRRILGIGKQEIESYINFVKLKIKTKELETVVQFSENVQTPLLGREGFFNYFERITFNVKKRFLELKY